MEACQPNNRCFQPASYAVVGIGALAFVLGTIAISGMIIGGGFPQKLGNVFGKGGALALQASGAGSVTLVALLALSCSQRKRQKSEREDSRQMTEEQSVALADSQQPGENKERANREVNAVVSSSAAPKPPSQVKSKNAAKQPTSAEKSLLSVTDSRFNCKSLNLKMVSGSKPWLVWAESEVADEPRSFLKPRTGYRVKSFFSLADNAGWQKSLADKKMFSGDARLAWVTTVIKEEEQAKSSAAKDAEAAKPKPQAKPSAAKDAEAAKPRPQAKPSAAKDAEAAKPKPQAKPPAAKGAEAAKPKPQAKPSAAKGAEAAKPKPQAKPSAAKGAEAAKPKPQAKPSAAKGAEAAEKPKFLSEKELYQLISDKGERMKRSSNAGFTIWKHALPKSKLNVYVVIQTKHAKKGFDEVFSLPNAQKVVCSEVKNDSLLKSIDKLIGFGVERDHIWIVQEPQQGAMRGGGGVGAPEPVKSTEAETTSTAVNQNDEDI